MSKLSACSGASALHVLVHDWTDVTDDCIMGLLVLGGTVMCVSLHPWSLFLVAGLLHRSCRSSRMMIDHNEPTCWPRTASSATTANTSVPLGLQQLPVAPDAST